jgi:hypothetical protein
VGRLDFKSSLRGGDPVVGGFDSHTLPPNKILKGLGPFFIYRVERTLAIIAIYNHMVYTIFTQINGLHKDLGDYYSTS